MSRIDTRLRDQKPGLAFRVVRLVKREGLIRTVLSLKRWFLYKAHYHLYDKSFEHFEPMQTSKSVRAIDLDYDEEFRRHSVEYLAAPRLLVHWSIKLIAEPLSRFTFIDIGSGLGRPLLVAAQYPFKAAIGYELSPSLHRGAVANIERSRTALDLRTPTKSVNANAVEADWPGGSRVFFLFNPFDREFMQRFLERIPETATAGTRHYLLLLNFKHPELMARSPFQPCPGGLVDRAIWKLLSPYPLRIYLYEAPGHRLQKGCCYGL